MANPLTQRRPEAYEGPRYEYRDRQALIDRYNSELKRPGIEWALDDSGNPYLRDTQEYTNRKTRWLEARAEAERRKFLHFQSRPYQADAA